VTLKNICEKKKEIKLLCMNNYDIKYK